MHRRPLLEHARVLSARFSRGRRRSSIGSSRWSRRMPIASSGRAGRDTSRGPRGSCRPIGGGACSRIIASSIAGCSSGGHADGQTQVEEVALREAREESGMTELRPGADRRRAVAAGPRRAHDSRPLRRGRPADRRRPRAPRRAVSAGGPRGTGSSRPATSRTKSAGSLPKKCCGSPTKRACCGCSIRRRSSSIKSKGPIARNSPADRLPGGEFFCERAAGVSRTCRGQALVADRASQRRELAQRMASKGGLRFLAVEEHGANLPVLAEERQRSRWLVPSRGGSPSRGSPRGDTTAARPTRRRRSRDEHRRSLVVRQLRPGAKEPPHDRPERVLRMTVVLLRERATRRSASNRAPAPARRRPRSAESR